MYGNGYDVCSIVTLAYWGRSKDSPDLAAVERAMRRAGFEVSRDRGLGVGDVLDGTRGDVQVEVSVGMVSDGCLLLDAGN